MRGRDSNCDGDDSEGDVGNDHDSNGEVKWMVMIRVMLTRIMMTMVIMTVISMTRSYR